VNDCIQIAKQHQKVDEKIKKLSSEMEAQAVKPMDALHVACAEAAGCDYFLTCDDRLIKRYNGKIKVDNPVNFILLTTENDHESENAD
jgi:predicted nucleic acid-binding protein